MKEEKNKKNTFQQEEFGFFFEGKKIFFEINSVANKSEKSVLCYFGGTTVLTTILVQEKEEKEKQTFFPLTVFFDIRAYAVGKIPFLTNKREGRMNNFSVKTSRLIDRALRVFFPLNVNKEVQISNLVFSLDRECSPVLAAFWSSFLVCYLSEQLPFFKTIFSAVTISKKNKSEMFCNASLEELFVSDLDLFLSSTEKESVIALELTSKEISEEEFEKAIDLAKKKMNFLFLY